MINVIQVIQSLFFINVTISKIKITFIFNHFYFTLQTTIDYTRPQQYKIYIYYNITFIIYHLPKTQYNPLLKHKKFKQS